LTRAPGGARVRELIESRGAPVPRTHAGGLDRLFLFGVHSMNEIETIYLQSMENIFSGGIESMFQNDIITSIIKDAFKTEKKDGGHLCGHIDISVNDYENKDFDLFIIIKPQYRVGKYILDFAISIAGIKGIPALDFAIEIDGHDFHEKTKAQAKHDRERERVLISSGYIIIRYTGSEVFNAAEDCARDTIGTILDFITKVWDLENV
jgi:very-short-patch-repair endonuclease